MPPQGGVVSETEYCYGGRLTAQLDCTALGQQSTTFDPDAQFSCHPNGLTQRNGCAGSAAHLCLSQQAVGHGKTSGIATFLNLQEYGLQSLHDIVALCLCRPE